MRLALTIFLSAALASQALADTVLKFDDFLKDNPDGFAAMDKIMDAVRSKNGEPVTLEFSEKTYDFPKASNNSWFFKIQGVKNLTVEGNGAKLMIDPFNAYCSIVESSNIKIRNFNFTHNKLAFTQGDIVEINPKENSFVLKLDDGYPEFPTHEFVMQNYPQDQWMWGSFMDRKERTLRYGYPAHMYISRIEPTDKARHWKFYAREGFNEMAMIEVGTAFVAPIHQEPNKSWLGRHGPYTVSISGSADIRIENVTAAATRHAGWSVHANEGKIVFKNCIITWRNDVDLISSWRDGSHSKNNKVGPVFDSCTWEGLLDDSINISSNPIMFSEACGDAIYRMHGTPPKKGSPIGVYYPDTGKWIESEDLFVEYVNGNMLKLSKPLDGLVLRKDFKPEEWHTKRSMNAKATQLYGLNYVNKGFVVRNCTFGKQRRYAMIIRSHDGIVEKNKILGGDGAVFSNETGGWYEGPLPQNIKIRNNVFKNLWGPCAIEINVQTVPSSINADSDLNISITNNEFVYGPMTRFAVDILGGSNIKFSKNKYFSEQGERILPQEAINQNARASNISIKD